MPPRPAPGTPGTFGWHELYSSDWTAAFAFYEKLFGWSKRDALDMGPMGTYQLFATGSDQDCGATGGMKNAMPGGPKNVWTFYINVEATDAAIDRITEKGGKILNGPMQVPGGSWIAKVEGVRVDRSLRGLGIGEQMLDTIIEKSRARGCKQLQLTTDKRRVDAQRFYVRLGFEASHEGMKINLF